MDLAVIEWVPYCVDLDRQKAGIFYKLDPEIATFDMWVSTFPVQRHFMKETLTDGIESTKNIRMHTAGIQWPLIWEITPTYRAHSGVSLYQARAACGLPYLLDARPITINHSPSISQKIEETALGEFLNWDCGLRAGKYRGSEGCRRHSNAL